jgi:hypothetical protein
MELTLWEKGDLPLLAMLEGTILAAPRSGIREMPDKITPARGAA